MGRQITVQALVSDGYTRLWAHCVANHCHHHGVIEISLLPPWAVPMCLDDLPLQCTACGNRRRVNGEITAYLDADETRDQRGRLAKVGRLWVLDGLPPDPEIELARQRGKYP